VTAPEGRARFVDRIRPGTARRFPDLVESRDAFDAVAAAFLLARPAAGGGPVEATAPSEAAVEGEIWPPAPGTRFGGRPGPS
jgi:hypothetical protein